MKKSVLHQPGWLSGSAQQLVTKQTTLSGHHLSLVFDNRRLRLYGAHLTAPNAMPYNLTCDQDIRIPTNIARKAWEWTLNELPVHRSSSILGGISGTELAVLKWQGFLVETSVTYLTSLSAELDIFASFGSKRRNIIKREASRLTVVNNAPVDEFLDFLSKTYQRKGLSNLDIPTLANRMKWAVSENKGGVTTAYTADGVFSAGVFCLWDETLCHYLFGSTNSELPSPEGNSLCLYETMLQRQGKTKAFNFEGSILRGVDSFVRSFNPEPVLLAGLRQTLWTKNSKHLPFLRRLII